LLSVNIPKPLHGVAPRVILGSAWWDKTRKEAYRSTFYHCIACGVYKHQARFRKWLEGHELYTVDYLIGRSYYLETVPLCHCCHNYIHSGRLQSLLEQNEISIKKYVAIQQHGDAVLEQAGLSKPPVYNGPFAPWEDWRLVLDGKEYGPKYKNEKEWENGVRGK
jgi:hypothetical protein